MPWYCLSMLWDWLLDSRFMWDTRNICSVFGESINLPIGKQLQFPHNSSVIRSCWDMLDVYFPRRRYSRCPTRKTRLSASSKSHLTVLMTRRVQAGPCYLASRYILEEGLSFQGETSFGYGELMSLSSMPIGTSPLPFACWQEIPTMGSHPSFLFLHPWRSRICTDSDRHVISRNPFRLIIRIHTQTHQISTSLASNRSPATVTSLGNSLLEFQCRSLGGCVTLIAGDDTDLLRLGRGRRFVGAIRPFASRTWAKLSRGHFCIRCRHELFVHEPHISLSYLVDIAWSVYWQRVPDWSSKGTDFCGWDAIQCYCGGGFGEYFCTSGIVEVESRYGDCKWRRAARPNEETKIFIEVYCNFHEFGSYRAVISTDEIRGNEKGQDKRYIKADWIDSRITRLKGHPTDYFSQW